MEIIILAGGLGTRLANLTKDLPKPMVPIAGSKPFLKYLLDFIITKHTISKIILSVGYKHEIIVDYFGNEYLGIPIFYAIEQELLGTGGAIKMAMSFVSGENFLVINGDTYFNINLNDFYQKHVNTNSNVSMALKPMKNFDRYGNVLLKEDNIIKFEEKQFKSYGNINAGIYAIKKQYLELLSLPKKFSIETDVFKNNCLKDNYKGFIYDNYFIDIGIPEDYERANRDFIKFI